MFHMPSLDRKAQKESLETAAHLQFLRVVFEKKLPVYLLGSYADDALLHKSVSKAHSDIDLATLRANSERLRHEFEDMGLNVTEKSFAEGEPPYKLLVKGKHLLVDVALFDRDDQELPFMNALDSKTGDKLKLVFDKNVFDDAPQELNGMTVATVSPLALIRSKDAYYQAGMGPSREKDVVRKQSLVDKFYPSVRTDSDHFKLRISRIK